MPTLDRGKIPVIISRVKSLKRFDVGRKINFIKEMESICIVPP